MNEYENVFGYIENTTHKSNKPIRNNTNKISDSREDYRVEINVDIKYIIEKDTLFIVFPKNIQSYIETKTKEALNIVQNVELEDAKYPFFLKFNMEELGVTLYLAPFLYYSIKEVKINFQ